MAVQGASPGQVEVMLREAQPPLDVGLKERHEENEWGRKLRMKGEKR